MKEINDTTGHFNGDRILKQVAMRLSGSTRESDTLARMGGNEFAVLLPSVTSLAGVEEVAKKIKNALLPPFVIEGLTLDIQASIGAVIFPEHGEDVDTLIQRADVAMYVAKQGGNGYVIYSPKLDQYSPQRLTLMGELRQAIEHDNLFLTFQPKVDLRNNRVSDVEVLVRWQHKDHGMVAPDEFISLAYLKKLPVKELKIDKSFVMDMLKNESDAVIVQATIGMAHSLGLKVVAEGVESKEAVSRASRNWVATPCRGIISANPSTPKSLPPGLNPPPGVEIK